MTDTRSVLSQEQREQLLDALQDRLTAAARADGIPQRPAGTPACASFLQRRLWFLDRLEPGNGAYNVPIILRLRGRLDVAALDRALRAVMDRHEVLRTTFTEIDGELLQRVRPLGDGPLVVLADPVDADDPAGADELSEWIDHACYEPFDLAAGPLLRCALRRVGADTHLFVITAHHSVIDGASLGILVQELAECQAAFTAGGTPRLAPLDIQYADFAVWQREHLGADALAGELDYWRQTLAGAPPVLDLPRDAERVPSGKFAGASLTRTLDPRTVTRLRGLAAAEGATTFITVLAAVQLLLGRLVGTQDVVVGAPIAGRSRPELEPLIGPFLNTLALRTDLSGQPTFRQLLGRVRETSLAAYDHQDLPFEQLVEAIQPERSTTHAPVFQVMVNHTGATVSVPRLGDAAVEVVGLTDPPAKLPLTLYLGEEDSRSGKLVIDTLYQSALFSRQRVGHLLDQLEYLLDQVGTDPDRAIQAYSLVPPSDRALLPDPTLALVREPAPSVRAMIEAWVRDTPDAVALRYGPQSWTYPRLWRCAAAIRQRLVACGATPGTVVAVTGPRTPGLVAAMVAVVAGDGVLLTLDPRLPRIRQQAMITESGATHLIVVGGHDAEPAVNTDDLDVIRIAATPAEDLVAEDLVAGDAEPGYVFFTSGTSGVPKGVRGRRAGLAHFLAWQRDTFGIGPGDRCAHLTGLSFDVVLRDVFLPLVSGATLVVPEQGDELAPADCLPWLAAEEITCVHTVPTLAEVWLAERPPGTDGPSALRHTFFAGEPLRGDLVHAWRAACVGGPVDPGALDEATVINLYGPTETTLATCAYVVPADCDRGVQPIGVAIPGTQVHILRPDGGGCGIGEIGEIVVRSPYRSLGYLNVPDSPAWLANPATNDPEDLLYRTGDLGRLRPGGAIDILSRLDRQVKIRGVRVETDEVAAVLCRHPGVAQAVVTDRRDATGRPILVAYVVSPASTEVTATQLRSYLTRRLPAAMVPSVFGFIDEIPGTLNGKIDWAALPAVTPPSEAAAGYVAPRTEAERRVSDIVGVLLNRDRVSVEDDFFALGGHSLLAMQLVSRITEALGVVLPLQAIFEARTVVAIAAAAVAAGATDAIAGGQS